jgi:hypothetical protein
MALQGCVLPGDRAGSVKDDPARPRKPRIGLRRIDLVLLSWKQAKYYSLQNEIK